MYVLWRNNFSFRPIDRDTRSKIFAHKTANKNKTHKLHRTNFENNKVIIKDASIDGINIVKQINDFILNVKQRFLYIDEDIGSDVTPISDPKQEKKYINYHFRQKIVTIFSCIPILYFYFLGSQIFNNIIQSHFIIMPFDKQFIVI